MIGLIDDEDEVMLKIIREPVADPLDVALSTDRMRRLCGRGYALDLAQNLLGMGGDRVREQITLMRICNRIGASGGGDHRKHDRQDCNRNDGADQHDHAQAGPLPNAAFGLAPRSRVAIG